MRAPFGDDTARPRGAFAVLGAVQSTLIATITLLAVPLPAIRVELGLSSDELLLVSAAYGLSFAGLLLFGGRMSDRFGGRRMFAVGLAVFAASSVAAPASTGVALLLASRFGQGAGAALIAPAAVVLLRSTLPEPQRFEQAMAAWGSLSVLGATGGIVVSGVVTTFVSWRWLFAVPLVVSAAGLLLQRRFLPPGPPGKPAHLDIQGALLATAGLTLLSFGLIRTGDAGWGSAAAAAPMAIGLALLVAFAAIEARTAQPLLPLSFLADNRRALALSLLALSSAATAVACLFVSVYLQEIRGWTPMRTSVGFLPYAAALVATGWVAGPAVRRVGEAAALAAGSLLRREGCSCSPESVPTPRTRLFSCRAYSRCLPVSHSPSQPVRSWPSRMSRSTSSAWPPAR